MLTKPSATYTQKNIYVNIGTDLCVTHAIMTGHGKLYTFNSTTKNGPVFPNHYIERKIYVRNKTKACGEVGIKSFEHILPEDTKEAELLKIIEGKTTKKPQDGVRDETDFFLILLNNII